MVKAQVYCTTQEGNYLGQAFVSVIDTEGKEAFGLLPARRIKEGNKLEINILMEYGNTSLVQLPNGFSQETALLPSYQIQLVA